MAKDLLDFSKFKKIFEDDKNTHLKHPKGHTIIVAHVALSPKLKKQIADLPMHPEKMVELAQDIMEQMPHKMAEGGEAKPFKGYNPEKHSRTGGLNDAYREKYNREHGSDLKRPVTGNPKPGSEAAGRKKSFCARMKGVKGPTSEGGELTPKGAALKRWNCHAHGGKIEDTDHDEECMHYAKGGNVEKPAVSRIDMNYKDVTKRIPQLTEAANKLAGGKLSASEYDALVNKHKPVEAYGFVPQPASREDAMRALNESKRKMYGKTSEIEPGEQTDLRLDIPAYKDHGVWVNSIHRKDAPTVYGSVSAVKNAQMVPSSEKALRVAAGGPKAPFAVIRGEWHPMEEQEAVEKAQKYLKHKDWKQVGYDPERHGYFYDRETMQPIEGAEQVIQIGPLVLAKKPKYGKKEEQLFAKGGDVQEEEQLTSRGEPLTVKEGLKAPEWEFGENPVLHTKKGSIPLRFPKKSDSTYQDILRAKELNEPHEEAMSQWLPRNKALQEGKPLSSRTVGLNNLMSILSANTATPQMELSFSRLLDASRKLGIDPRSPEFAEAIKPGGKVYELWEKMDSPQSFPEQGREYFEGPAKEAFLQKGESKVTGRKPGDIVSTSPSRKTFAERLSKFPASIQYYTRLANKHGADAVAYAEELARDKVRAEAYAAKAERLRKKGEPVPEFEGDPGALAPVGLGTKTNLFAHEMSGAGNSMIPDTHILRSVFGLDARNPGDSATLEHIKQTLLAPQNYHLLKQLNEHYQKEHPAHEYAAEKYGLGKGNPQATFPAHWIHWNTVPHYEKAQGIGRPSTARNLTTHGNIFKALNEPHEYMAEGGQVGFDAIKKERYYNGGAVRHYADAGFVDPLTEEEKQLYRAPAALPETAPVSSDQRTEATLPQRFHRQNIVQTESGGRQFDESGNPLTGTSGEIGASQIMPEMAPKFAQQTGMEWNPELFSRRRTGDAAKDQETQDYNLELGARAFNKLYENYEGDLAKTIAAYNTGEPNVNKAVEKSMREGGTWLDHVDPRTRRYVFENLAREEGLQNPREYAAQKAGVPLEEQAAAPERTPAEQASETAAIKPEVSENGLYYSSHPGVTPLRPTVRKQIQDEYNSIVSKPQAVEDSDIFSGNITGTPDPNMFGPNGEPPTYLNESAYEQAEERVRQKIIQSREQKTIQAQEIARKNAIRERANVPLLGTGAQKPVTQPAKTPTTVGGPAETPATVGGPAETPAMAAGAPESKLDLTGPGSPFQQAYAGYKAGAEEQASVIGQRSREQAYELEQQQKELASLNNKFNNNLQTFMNQNQAITNAFLTEKIDPMAAWNEKSIPSKVLSTIGIIVSGIGAGLLRQDNAALKVLQAQLDKSVEGQKMNLGRYDNLLKYNLSTLGNYKAAVEMTRAQIGEITLKKIEQEAKKYEGPEAEAKAKMLISEATQKFVAGPMMKAAIWQTAMDPTLTEQQAVRLITEAKAFSPEAANELEARLVPGYGIADLRALDPANLNIVKNSNVFLSNAQKLIKMMQYAKGMIAVNPFPNEDKDAAKSLAHGLMSELAKAHGTEVSEGKMGWLSDQMGDPTSVIDAIWNNQASLKQTMDEMFNRKKAALSQAFSNKRLESYLKRDEMQLPEYQEEQVKHLKDKYDRRNR